MFFAETEVTFSEKFNTMLADVDTPVALSAGTDDDKVGAVVSTAVRHEIAAVPTGHTNSIHPAAKDVART
jgi:hypothetical protein